MTSTTPPTIFIAGCGYVGWRLIDALPTGSRIGALSHSAKNSAALQRRGIGTTRADLDRDTVLNLPALTDSSLYYFIPPPSNGTQDPRLQRFLAALDTLPAAALPQRIILISATGVYGDCGGDWVDEQRPPAPDTDRGHRRLHAETTLVDWGRRHRVATIVLRVAGIYGPARLPIARLQQGLPVLREQDAPWSNRIHIDDLIQACLAAARHGVAGHCYNIADGHPSTMSDYFFQVAKLLGLAQPPGITLQQARQQMSPGMLSYLAESRRLDNRRLREQLRVTLHYPNLASGLPSCRPDQQPDPN